jgi:hypothetical protein
MSDAQLRETMLQSQLTIAIIELMQRSWPMPIDLHSSAVNETDDTAFVQAIHGLVDDGLMMIEALLPDLYGDPIAQGAVLTRKGATVLYHVTRPI